METIVRNIFEKIKRKASKICSDCGKVERRALGEILIGIASCKRSKIK
jgi:hypothetical protein